MLFGRALRLANSESIEESNQSIILPKKLNNIVNHFWERWKKEYLINLRENQKIVTPNSNQPIINNNDIVLISEEKLPRSAWRIGVVEELVLGKDTLKEETFAKQSFASRKNREIFGRNFRERPLSAFFARINFRERPLFMFFAGINFREEPFVAKKIN